MNVLTTDVLTEAVTAATLAPSMHNTQPWLFRREGDAIDLHADYRRELPVADPLHRAVRISCGAALFNLRLGLAVLGCPMEVRLMPEPGRPEILARLTPASPRPPTPAERELYAAIPRRHTSREPFLDTQVPAEHRHRLSQAAAAEHCWLMLTDDPAEVRRIAAILRAADRELTSDPAYQAEMRAWTSRSPGSLDGIPRSAAGPAAQAYELLMRRDFGGAPHQSGRDYETEPLIGILGAHGDLPSDEVRAGQALQHVLLTATVLGLSAGMYSQPMDAPGARDALWRELRWRGSPQMLLRLGYGLPAPASPRRPAADVIIP
ncbi:Acg family FMN-binding oxidoreductase [Longispora albida]|uniref:Acg family FMN-binding oxidoreductase n=1 Tax=Longispora albida TaxID=203523 RepID=UPI00035D3237|nr:hypothetical protein [Longispora albida]